MNIAIQNLGRRYNRNWIFSHLDYEFKLGGSYAILGPNGSGKSTLLQILFGYLSPSEGEVHYENNGKEIVREDIYKWIGFLAPYLEIPNQLTVQEFFDFHLGLRGFDPNIKLDDELKESGLIENWKKPIQDLSSGMLQRTKILVIFASNNPILLLDEPTINLDESGQIWFQSILKRFMANKLIIMGSNLPREYESCENCLEIENYKKR